MKVLLEASHYTCTPRGNDRIIFSASDPNYQVGSVRFDDTGFHFEVLSRAHYDATEDELMECSVHLNLPIYFDGLAIASVAGQCIKLAFAFSAETIDLNPEILTKFREWKRSLDQIVNDRLK